MIAQEMHQGSTAVVGQGHDVGGRFGSDRERFHAFAGQASDLHVIHLGGNLGQLRFPDALVPVTDRRHHAPDWGGHARPPFEMHFVRRGEGDRFGLAAELDAHHGQGVGDRDGTAGARALLEVDLGQGFGIGVQPGGWAAPARAGLPDFAELAEAGHLAHGPVDRRSRALDLGGGRGPSGRGCRLEALDRAGWLPFRSGRRPVGAALAVLASRAFFSLPRWSCLAFLGCQWAGRLLLRACFLAPAQRCRLLDRVLALGQSPSPSALGGGDHAFALGKRMSGGSSGSLDGLTQRSRSSGLAGQMANATRQAATAARRGARTGTCQRQATPRGPDPATAH